MLKFADRMHPMQGILSETSLSVSAWVAPTTETFIHTNMFLHYGREDTKPCKITLPDRETISKDVRKILMQA